MSVAMMFGIAAVANEFVPLFFGDEFEPCIPLTIVMAPVMLIKAISTTIRFQYLVPRKMESIFIASVSLGAACNVVANYLLIPVYGALGAIYGTLIAEAVACAVQVIFMQKKVNVIGALLRSLPYVLMGVVMFAAVRFTAGIVSAGNLVLVIIEVIVGVAVFGVQCVIYWKIFKEKTVIDVFFKAVGNKQ